jgi:hypothetical protein
VSVGEENVAVGWLVEEQGKREEGVWKCSERQVLARQACVCVCLRDDDAEERSRECGNTHTQPHACELRCRGKCEC